MHRVVCDWIQNKRVDSAAGEYWVVNQILAKGLHNSDGDILNYTTSLMDKLEKVCLVGMSLLSSANTNADARSTDQE